MPSLPAATILHNAGNVHQVVQVKSHFRQSPTAGILGYRIFFASIKTSSPHSYSITSSLQYKAYYLDNGGNKTENIDIIGSVTGPCF